MNLKSQFFLINRTGGSIPQVIVNEDKIHMSPPFVSYLCFHHAMIQISVKQAKRNPTSQTLNDTLSLVPLLSDKYES